MQFVDCMTLVRNGKAQGDSNGRDNGCDNGHANGNGHPPGRGNGRARCRPSACQMPNAQGLAARVGMDAEQLAGPRSGCSRSPSASFPAARRAA